MHCVLNNEGEISSGDYLSVIAIHTLCSLTPAKVGYTGWPKNVTQGSVATSDILEV